MARLAWIGLVALVACDPESADVDIEDDGPPDITGVYEVQLVEQTGCADQTPPLDWVTPDLTVTGTADDLLFAFGDSVAIPGTVDTTFTWEMSTLELLDGWQLDLFGEGLAYIGDDVWVLDGELVVNATEDGTGTQCEATLTLEAIQIP